MEPGYPLVQFPSSELRPAPATLTESCELLVLDVCVEMAALLSDFDGGRPDMRRTAAQEWKLAGMLGEVAIVLSDGFTPRFADDLSEYDRYFLVGRGDLNPLHWLAQVAGVGAKLLGDLPHALLDRGAVVGFLRGLHAELVRHVSTEVVERPLHADPGRPRVAESLVPLQPLEVWRVGHHAYGIFNRCAAAEISASRSRFARSLFAEAAESLERAATFVEAMTSTLIWAGDISRETYGAIVRPTMDVPSCGVKLTGGMNIEHQLFRKEIKALVDDLPMSDAELFAVDESLADARNRLLLRDLHDIELHVDVAWKAVADDRALHQGDESPVAAVAALRGMALKRARLYTSMTNHDTIEEL